MTNTRDTPAETLAKRITHQLAEEALIDPERAGGIADSLSAGTMKEQDWRFELEPVEQRKKTPKKKPTKGR